MNVVKIDCKNITNWETFHKEFSEKFGFPDFYGENMDAWIDCMTSLDKPEDGLTKVHLEKDNIITLQLDNVNEFAKNLPEQYNSIIECTAFVNYRKITEGDNPVLALSFYKSDN